MTVSASPSRCKASINGLPTRLEWDVYSPTRSARTQTDSGAGDFGVPTGTRLVATLDDALSTRNAHAEDRFTITARSPSQYEGAVIEGTVSSVNASGRLSGRADMALNFESIRLRNGRTYPFAGVIENLRTADGETIRVDNEGTVEDNSQTEKAISGARSVQPSAPSLAPSRVAVKAPPSVR